MSNTAGFEPNDELRAALARVAPHIQHCGCEALGFLQSSTAHLMSHPKQQELQADIDHSVALLCVAHLMSWFEEGVAERYWDQIFEPEFVMRLRALKHLRAQAGEGLRTRRTPAFREDFANAQFDGVLECDDTTLRLGRSVVPHVQRLLLDAHTKALVRSANGWRP